MKLFYIKNILNQCIFFIFVLVLSISIVIFISYYFSKNDYYFLDKSENNQIYRIKYLNLVLEFPISNNTFEKIKNLDDFNIKKDIIYAWDFDKHEDQGKENTHFQIEKSFLKYNLIKKTFNGYSYQNNLSLKNLEYVLYADIPYEKIKNIKYPYLFLYMSLSPYELWLNNNLIKIGSDRKAYLGSDQLILNPKNKIIRIIWKIKNNNHYSIKSLHLGHGIYIISENIYDKWIKTFQLWRINSQGIPFIVFFILGLISFYLSYLDKKYFDIWTFSLFCFSASLIFFIETWYFYRHFQDIENGGKIINSITAVCHLILVLSNTLLILGFFRFKIKTYSLKNLYQSVIKGKYKDLISLNDVFINIFLATLISGVYAVVSNWPLTSSLEPWDSLYKIDKYLAHILLISCVFSICYGVYVLVDKKREFIQIGDEANTKRMNVRLAFASVFCIGALIMSIAFFRGLPLRSFSAGVDSFMLWLFAPSFLMFSMLIYMIKSHSKFYEKIAPSLDYIEDLILVKGDKAIYEYDYVNKKFKEDNEGYRVYKHYIGVVLAFDLKGFKAIDYLRNIDYKYEKEVINFYKTVQTDLDTLIKNISYDTRIFKAKYDGDQNLYVIYAKDINKAWEIYQRFILQWFVSGYQFIYQWKSQLLEKLNFIINNSDNIDTIDYIDLHTLVCIDDKIRIKLCADKNQKNDFDSQKLTKLSQAFKSSNHLKIAVFEDQFNELITKEITYKNIFKFIPAVDQSTINKFDNNKNKNTNKEYLDTKALENTGYMCFVDENINSLNEKLKILKAS